ncbi:zinc ribbon domain-containing protein [Bacteroides salyersiae]|uniref:zinc ribbon domain-containing protein n=1 Tax=Bacteroides TaxID=816 RepID=UPI00189DF7B8|nr:MULTISPECIES: zinc ribbon domain-containing protein [Bacteroides]MBV4206204.1 zinc ribbon domain-containing protein [Bacteroides salyersiae]MCB6651496.1 zinc ribbon domain-containing protein [Bacteroides salyersiae]
MSEVKQCSKCGAANLKNAKFCINCGNPLNFPEVTPLPPKVSVVLPTPEIAKKVCPNCGANITNTMNCEYCGSLLIRLDNKGIDKSLYMDNRLVFSGLIEELKTCLNLQKSNTSLHKNFILTVTDNDDKILARITSPYYTRDMLNRHFPCFDDENKTSGLAICFNFTIDHDESEVENRIKVEEKHNRFRGLDIFDLFTTYRSEETVPLVDENDNKIRDCNVIMYDYIIDFGNDAEGAARLISRVLQVVNEIPLNANLKYYIDETHFADVQNEEQYEDSYNGGSNWIYWGGHVICAIIGYYATGQIWGIGVGMLFFEGLYRFLLR